MAASKRWNVYAKRPFGGVNSIIVYLGRYTHRVAISLKRITAVGQSSVTFDYKDYRQGADYQASEMEGVEFVRRFLRHVLPKGFQRIRYYGCCRAAAVKQIGQGLSEQWLKLARRIEALAAVLLQLPPPEECVGLPCPRCREAILQPAGFCLYAPWDSS